MGNEKSTRKVQRQPDVPSATVRTGVNRGMSRDNPDEDSGSGSSGHPGYKK